MSDECPEDQSMFITEKSCFTDLVKGLSSSCPCGLTMKPWQLESVTQVRTNDMHVHVDSCVNFRKDMCYELSSLAVVVIGKGPGQVQGFSVDIT